MTHTPIYQLFFAGRPGTAYLHRADAIKASDAEGSSVQYTISGTRYMDNAEVRELVQVAFPMDFGALGHLDVTARYTVKHNALGLPVVRVSEIHVAGLGYIFTLPRLNANAVVSVRNEVARVIETDLLEQMEAAA
jgi:hypothetical protein